jgi:uroporphyrinogen III methyltransferase/synthase
MTSRGAGRGVVCYVGLGPGDPRVLAQRAADRLAQADAVLGDAADESASEGGESEGAGAGATIVDRAVALAREGKRVARTVPFDAFESPRIIEEMRAVRRAGVDLEVVPGIGARTAAATFAGALGTATYVPQGEVASVLASVEANALVTLVAHAGSPSQRVVTTTAAGAPARAGEMVAGAGGVIVVRGAPDPDLAWFEQRPLFGKRVLVTRARDQAGSTAALLREYGAEPVVVPTIEIRPPQDPSALVHALGELRAGAYTWAAFTSANGVDRTWDVLRALGADARAFGGVKLAAIGPSTAAALERRGLHPDVVAKEFRGEGLAGEMLAALATSAPPDALTSGSTKPRILLARAAKARDVLPETLRAAGCQVDVVAAYETHPPPIATVRALAEALASGRIDAVTFTSSSTVDNFCDLLGEPSDQGSDQRSDQGTDQGTDQGIGEPVHERLRHVRVASIGPVTSETARARGIEVDVTAREYTVFGLVQALAESYG